MTAVALPERRFANAIRALAMDAVQKANSGHPGAPMGIGRIDDKPLIGSDLGGLGLGGHGLGHHVGIIKIFNAVGITVADNEV